MPPRSRTAGFLLAVLAVLVLPLSTAAQGQGGSVENQISVYTGDNAVGYLQPLADAFGATLNSSFSYSAYIPKASFHLGLEVPVMGLFFADEDRTFLANTESGFQPDSTATVPTVVGSGEAVTITGQGGATFSFPGGLDLNSFGLAVPQLRLSSLMGTEAIVRWIAFETGDNELGDVSLFGIGARHSVSQYFAALPVDLAAGFMWQTFELGKDFITADALALQLQASRRMPIGFMTLEPFSAIGYDRFKMDIKYEDANDNPVAVEFDPNNTVRFTVGAGLNFAAGQLWADYSFSETSNFSFGLALGNLGR